MDLNALKDTPPWEWPADAGTKLLAVLRDGKAAEPDRHLAAELAGDSTVVNDDLADALLTLVRRESEPPALRATAATSLGPALEEADTEGFEDPDDSPISERTFRRIQDVLREVYEDAGTAAEVRRRALEASVRAPQDWHREAIGAAWSSGDADWKRTAAFGMQFVRGFDALILEALGSPDVGLQYEALVAAGSWEMDAAWPHVVEVVTSEETDKPLLLAAIEAAGYIRPLEARELLGEFLDSEDEDVVDAAAEAIAMAEGAAGEEDEDDEFSR